MTFSETTGRGFIILAGIIALGAILACPAPPLPGPNGPGGAGGTSPAPVTCGPACLHAVSVCPTVKQATCLDLCGRELPAFAAALAAATGCADVKAADPGSAGTTSGPSRPVGR